MKASSFLWEAEASINCILKRCIMESLKKQPRNLRGEKETRKIPFSDIFEVFISSTQHFSSNQISAEL